MKNVLLELGRQALSGSILNLSTRRSTNAIPRVGFGYPRGYLDFGVGVNTRNRVVPVNRNRRIPRKMKNQGLEINKAEGGFKNIINTGIVDTIGINKYYELAVKKINNEWEYVIKDGLYTNDNIDLTDTMNQSEEFINKMKNSSQFLVKNFLISTDYTRIPSAGDNLPKLLLFALMDKIQVEDPKVEPNVMKIDMSRNGVKNFNFVINRRNTNVLNTGWQDSHYIWNGNCKLYVDKQGPIHITDDTGELAFVALGVMKVTITVLFRLQDSTNAAPSKLMTQKELNDKILKLEEENKKLKDKIDKEEEKRVELKKVLLNENEH